jgi:hypothetical protein
MAMKIGAVAIHQYLKSGELTSSLYGNGFSWKTYRDVQDTFDKTEPSMDTDEVKLLAKIPLEVSDTPGEQELWRALVALDRLGREADTSLSLLIAEFVQAGFEAGVKYGKSKKK